jgi:tRNA pseudouridine13 synthase
VPTLQIKTIPEDFVVDEIPAYEPSGEGNHVYLHVKKRDLPTDAAVRSIAKALGADARNAGVAGMKDKRAVTTQWISLEPPRGASMEEFLSRAAALSLDGIEILEVKRHGNKLKTGHLHGNRFRIVVRAVPDSKAFIDKAEKVAVTGVPNAFGEQRFGKEADNAKRALDIVAGREKPPRDTRLLRLLYSSLQSDVFNSVLEERVRRGTWATALKGDVLKKTDTGGLFVCTDEQEDAARAERGEVSATGPLPGPKMMRAEGEVAALEDEIARARLGDAYDPAFAGVLGEGTRRALRLFVKEMRVSCNPVANASGNEETSCTVEFVLPKGAFATTVLGHLMG